MSTKRYFIILPFIIMTLWLSSPAYAQLSKGMAMLGLPLDDFSLPILTGGKFTLSGVKNKNVLLVFPRGYSDAGKWCNICAYQYADLADAEEKQKLREKFNLDIFLVFPYDTPTVEKWFQDMPEVLKAIETWKVVNEELATSTNIKWAEYSRASFPKVFKFEAGQVPRPFPVLLDTNQELSNRLGIFRKEWWGGKADQNKPTLILLNQQKTVVFRTIAQDTLDRPSTDSLIKILSSLL